MYVAQVLNLVEQSQTPNLSNIYLIGLNNYSKKVFFLNIKTFERRPFIHFTDITKLPLDQWQWPVQP